MLAVCVNPVIHQVLNASFGAFKTNGEIILKNYSIEKLLVLLQVKALIKIIFKFMAEKILRTFVSCTKHPFEGHKI